MWPWRNGTNGTASTTQIGNQDRRGPAKGILDWFKRRAVGWPGPDAAQKLHIDGELMTERVRSGPSNVVFPWFLPYYDSDQTQHETPAMRQAYRKMLADPNVKAAVLGKTLAVCALDPKVIPASKTDRRDGAVADFVKYNLEESLAGGVPGLAWSILSGALLDGYSVCEKVWHLEQRGEYAGNYTLRACKPKDTGKDVVLETDEFRNVVGVRGLRWNPGAVYHPAAFVIYRHLPYFDTPTGTSDLRAVYSRWWMLDTVLKLRAVGLEKRAMPVMMGFYQTPQQRPSLEEALALVKSQNWLAIPEGVRVEALNVAGSADATFAEAVKDLKHDIFLGIQGAVLQALEGGTPSGRGSSQVHRTTADLLVWHLATSLEHVFNDREFGVVRDVVDLNFVVAKYPRVRLSAVDVDEQVRDMEIDQGLWSMGVDLSKDDVYERYNRKPPDGLQDKLAGQGAQEGGGGPPGMGGPKPPPPGGGGSPDLQGYADPLGRLRKMREARASLAGHADRFRRFDEGWDESKHKRASDGKFGSGGSSKKTADEGHKTATPAGKIKRAEGALGRAVEHMGGAAAAAKAAAAKVGEAAWAKLDDDEKKLFTQAFAAGSWVLHQAETGMRKGKEMAVQAAKERGLSDEQAERVGKVVGIVDTIAAWTVNVPAATLATGNPLAGKAAGLMPVASMAYLAYSAVRNPLAVLRAARKALTSKATAHSEFAFLFAEPDAMAALMDGIERAGEYADWYEALVMAALDQNNHDLAKAVEAADAAFVEPPAGLFGDQLPGGKAGGKTDADFDPAALEAGQRVEMEHTDDPDLAREIARDHLAEDPDYYAKLRRVEGGRATKLKEGDDATAEDDPQAIASMIAEVLYGLYGDDGMKFFKQGGKGADEFAEWSALDHPRGAGGRFIPRGSAEAHSAARAVVSKVIKGEKTPHSAEEVSKHLANLTVKQMRQIWAEHGRKIPSDIVRQQFVDAILERLPGQGKAGDEQEKRGAEGEAGDKQAGQKPDRQDAGAGGGVEGKGAPEPAEAEVKPGEGGKGPAGEKEPHEMTPDEFNRAVSDRAQELIGGDRKKYRGVAGQGRAVRDATQEMGGPHSEAVRKAREAGKPVAKEILDRYPHLKSPHEMTRDEYRTHAYMKGAAAPGGPRADDPHPLGGGTNLDFSRRNDVARALAAGKPVPPSVLADYPDLAPKPSTPDASPAAAPEAHPLLSRVPAEHRAAVSGTDPLRDDGKAATPGEADALAKKYGGSVPKLGAPAGETLSGAARYADVARGLKDSSISGPQLREFLAYFPPGGHDDVVMAKDGLARDAAGRKLARAAMGALSDQGKADMADWARSTLRLPRGSKDVAGTDEGRKRVAELVASRPLLGEYLAKEGYTVGGKALDAGGAPPATPAEKPAAPAPAAATARNPGSAPQDPPALKKARESEAARVLGLRDSYRKQAKEAGVSFDDVHGMAEQSRSLARDYIGQASAVIREAKALYEHYNGSPLTRGHKAFKGGDYTQLPKFDLVARTVAAKYPEFLGDPDDDAARQKLFDFVLAGAPTMPSREESYREAFDHAVAGKRAGGDEEVPF